MNVTLQVDRGTIHGPLPVEMPSATTVKYAVKRIAEEFDIDPEEPGLFLTSSSGALLPDDDIVEGLDGQRVFLIKKAGT